MKTSFPVALLALVLAACGPDKPPAEALRMVRTVELRYESVHEANRYSGTVQARHEVDQGFRVSGKVASRKVDVGQSVREGDVLAVLDDTDYRLAEEAARQQLVAATAQARQAESDRSRLQALKGDGSVSASDEEQRRPARSRRKPPPRRKSAGSSLRAPAEVHGAARLARRVVTQVRAEVGQVLGEGQPVVSIATQGEPRSWSMCPRSISHPSRSPSTRRRSPPRRGKPSKSACANSRSRRHSKPARIARG